MNYKRSITAKLPKNIFDNIFAFPPNRDTLGGTAYLIVENVGNILIDSPYLDQVNEDFLKSQGGISYLYITHRSAIAKAAEIQKKFDCTIIIQEQEAYLLPNLRVKTFTKKFALDTQIECIWTPGHSPGSSCLYYRKAGGVLFTGRNLLPLSDSEILPVKTATTFHWSRQIKSIELLKNIFTKENLTYICPGAYTGYLRGKGYIENAYENLSLIDLTKLSGMTTNAN
ncbi:MAG: MBL fold metallo-hydrolase [Cyanobacteria bacterium P01_A01_bin.45]